MDADVIQRDYDQRYPGVNSRVLAYYYAVGWPASENGWPAGAVEPMQWIDKNMDRAKEELGITHAGKLKDAEQKQCTELLWRYAAEERDASQMD